MMSYMGFFSAPALDRRPVSCLQDNPPMNLMENVFRRILPIMLATVTLALSAPMLGRPLLAQGSAATQRAGGEANLVIPDLASVQFFGMPGRSLLMSGLV